MRGGDRDAEIGTVRGGGKREGEGDTAIVARFGECGVRENGVGGGVFHSLTGWGC